VTEALTQDKTSVAFLYKIQMSTLIKTD